MSHLSTTANNMIQGIDTVQIRNAYMEMYVNHHGHLDEDKQLMSILTNQCSLAAQFDSKERSESPRCAESTRENILKSLRDWVESPTSTSPSRPKTTTSFPASLFWLHGGAGAGKSALAQSLAEQDKDNLAASFFFFATDASRNNGDKLFPTIIYQLTRIHNAFEKKVIAQLKKHPDIFNKGRNHQVKVLLTDPLNALYSEGVKASAFPRLIIIDGLDECKDIETQCDILSIIAQSIPHLPYPFRFLVASRPESHIIQTIKSNKYTKQIPIQQYDLSKDSDASKDIRTFLRQEFDKLCEVHPIASTLKNKGWPMEKDIKDLVDRSSGHFVYPSTVIKYIGSPKHRPDDRLEVVLGLNSRGKKEQPFSQLDALYRLILQDVEETKILFIKRSFSILYLISEKVGYFTIHRYGSSRIIQDMLLLRPGSLDLLFDPLRSLVVKECEEGNLRVFHKSLFDFLLDIERSGKFGLDKLLCHESAALYMLNTDILSSWCYAPDFMYFGYHCFLAQPIHDPRLIQFLENLDILYTVSSSANSSHNNTRDVNPTYQNEKALLKMFIDEGEQGPGAKTIFYVLRMLSLLSGFRQDLHARHCAKMVEFYGRIVPRARRSSTTDGRGDGNVTGFAVNWNGMPMKSLGSVYGDEDRHGYREKRELVDSHTALDQMIQSKLTSWQPSKAILGAIVAAMSVGSTSTADRDTLITREHTVFAAFAQAQHIPNSPYRLQSTLLPSISTSSAAEAMVVAHSYHIYTVEYEGDPFLMVLIGTYSRGGKRGVGAIVEAKGVGPGAVVSSSGFDISLLSDEEFEEQMRRFLRNHIAKVERELAQVVDDLFESKFEF